MLGLVLYQPDIPQNTGTLCRMAAALGLELHIVEPAGFPTSDRAFKRAGMDYLTHVQPIRHVSWEEFEHWRREQKRRLVLLTTKASQDYTTLVYNPDDLLMLGRESSGVPDSVHHACNHRVVVPLKAGTLG
jgi:tRNA (cytidine/uridine-2'-O-)-methyltransferase